MHRSAFKIQGYKGDVVVHHNGDWSGEAIICFQEEALGTDRPKAREVEIPAKLLVALGIPATRAMVTSLLESFAERLPETLGIYEASEKAVSDIRAKEESQKKPYWRTDDTVYGTKYVYCTQHCRVHDTGWCTVAVVDKIPLLSKTAVEAQEEWDRKAMWLSKGK